jgi:hypothetical protein
MPRTLAARTLTRQGQDGTARRDPSIGRRWAFRIAVAVLSLLSAGLAALGGIGSFSTVRTLAVPWFGAPSAWIAPAGIDTGILVLLGWDLLAEFLGMPWPMRSRSASAPGARRTRHRSRRAPARS